MGSTATRDAAGTRRALVVVLAGLVVLAAAVAGPWDPVLRGEEEPPPAAPPETVPTLPPPPPMDGMLDGLADLGLRSWDLRALWAVLAATLLGLVVWSLARLARSGRWAWGRRTPGEEAEPGDALRGTAVDPDVAVLRAGLRAAQEQLAVPGRPVDAVIAAWLALERAAGRCGVAREPSSTPTEFTVDVLDRTAADPVATRALLEVYLRARFGTDPVTAHDVDAATDALTVLVRTLDGGPA